MTDRPRTARARPPLAAPALAALALVAALPACSPDASARPAADDADALARPLGVVAGFHAPESVRYDPERDVYYVSNIYLYGSEKDGNGFIAELDAADPRRGRILAQGGHRGVTLDAPKGLALHGDTLWTADIDVLRGFHRVTGAPLATVDFRAHHPTLLNDVAVGPDGTLRVTDTGIVMSRIGVIADTTGDRVFRVGPGGAISEIPAGMPYPKPNGITWDARGRRWLVVTFDQFASRLYALDDRTGARTPLADGKGQLGRRRGAGRRPHPRRELERLEHPPARPRPRLHEPRHAHRAAPEPARGPRRGHASRPHPGAGLRREPRRAVDAAAVTDG